MEERDLNLNLGMLCNCCNHSHHLPDVEGFTAGQRRIIEHLCTLCIESFQLNSLKP